MTQKIQTFRDLIAWQRAMELTRQLYLLTNRMPAEERFGLTNQMRRAAVSIPSNIAEGYARQSLADYLKFLRTARGSLSELMTQWEIATSLNMVAQNPDFAALMRETDTVLQFLIKSLQRKQTAQ
jgi:four helix bundle protein